MDHPQQANQSSTPSYNAQAFPPPPPESGAGQSSNLSMGEMNVHQGAASAQHPYQQQQQQSYPPPPPGGPSQHEYGTPPSYGGPQQQHEAYGSVHPQSTTQQYAQGHSDLPPYDPSHPDLSRPEKSGYGQSEEQGPPLPSRPQQSDYQPAAYQPTGQGSYQPPPPPQRRGQDFGDDDPSNPVHYTRDPHKLTAYLVPFPKPNIKGVDPAKVPLRFLIYTPPPPPLSKPAEGEKEGKVHKVQRKWQEEVRAAKTNTAKTASWQGVKSKATRGINKAIQYTTSSNLDFLGRVESPGSGSPERSGDEGTAAEKPKPVPIEEMVLIYPPSMNMSQEALRTEFVNTMLRTKSKAQRDTIIATGLMPVAYGIDILATLIWPFGGLGEIDTVWAYASFRGAKTARSVTKRLGGSPSSSSETPPTTTSIGTGAGTTSAPPLDPSHPSNHPSTTNPSSTGDQLRLNFLPSPRISLLSTYLDSECHSASSKLFPTYQTPPTESEVISAIGWHPSQSGGEQRNWEDEQWETEEVKEDLRTVMKKGAKEWKKWCEVFEKEPEKALKK